MLHYMELKKISSAAMAAIMLATPISVFADTTPVTTEEGLYAETVMTETPESAVLEADASENQFWTYFVTKEDDYDIVFSKYEIKSIDDWTPSLVDYTYTGPIVGNQAQYWDEYYDLVTPYWVRLPYGYTIGEDGKPNRYVAGWTSTKGGPIEYEPDEKFTISRDDMTFYQSGEDAPYKHGPGYGKIFYPVLADVVKPTPTHYPTIEEQCKEDAAKAYECIFEKPISYAELEQLLDEKLGLQHLGYGWRWSLKNRIATYTALFEIADADGLNLCHTCFIKKFYQVYLGRTPSQSELNYWIDDVIPNYKNPYNPTTEPAMHEEFRNVHAYISDAIALSDESRSHNQGKYSFMPTYPRNLTLQSAPCVFCGVMDNTTFYTEYAGNTGSTNPQPTPSPVVNTKKVTDFVTRLYDVCLGRKPDAAGLNDWVGKLTRKEITGAQAAYGFIFSQEFQNKNYCNTDYTKQLYRAFMGREFDQAGLNDWVGQLNSGKTREEVFNGFSQSNEFRKLCGEYGIDLGAPIAIPQYGTVPHGSCSVCGEQDGVTAFVTRLYKVCLDREPDKAGLNDWTSKLWNHTKSGREVSFGFIFSKEFTNKKYDNATYVDYLYKAFFDRSADKAGKADWLGKLNSGWTREQVFDGFVGSQEFDKLCNRYGIVRG